MNGYRYPLDGYLSKDNQYHDVWIYSRGIQTSGKSQPVEIPYRVKALYNAEDMGTLKHPGRKIYSIAVDRKTDRIVGVYVR